MKALFNRHMLFIIFNILLVLTEVTTDTLPCNNKQRFSAYGVIHYTLEVQNFSNKYITFDVKGDEPDINYVLSVYSDSGRQTRIQLAQGYNGNTKLYLSKKQNTQKIYLDLECSKYPCFGEIENKYSDYIKLEDGETLSYYVTESNKNMQFSLTSKEGSVKSNVWARGQLNIITMLDGQEKINKENYYIVNGIMTNTIFDVIGTEGDFINVGFIGYKDEQLKFNEQNYYLSQTKLHADGNTITGYLKKGVLDKICYQMTIGQKPAQDTVLFGIGNVPTKFAYVFIANSDGSRYTMPGEEIHPKGNILTFISSEQMESQYLCFTFPPENITNYYTYKQINEIVFTYQITQGLTETSQNLYEPQIRGTSYHRIIPKNSKISFIPQNNGDFDTMYWDLLTEYGFPQIYAVDCDEYPLCDLNKNKYFENAKSPHSINGISSYHYKKLLGTTYSPINKHQKLFVVDCKESQKTSEKISKYFDLVCSFDSLIYNEKDKMQLIEDNFYNQFAPKGKVNYYKIDLQHESNIQKVFIDVLIYQGEVSISIDSKRDGIVSDQYTSINKIYTSIKLDNKIIPSEKLDEITFSVKATSNSYYTILFNIGREDKGEMDALLKNDLPSGFSYLVTLDASAIDAYNIGNKVIKMKNQRLLDYVPFMVTFYSLNCEIEGHIIQLDEGNNPIEKEIYNKFGSFMYDVINPTEYRYNSEIYEYRLKVTKTDYSFYNKKLCKVYVSGIELGTEHDAHTRDILIPDNMPQQVMFGNNVTHVSFGYPHVNMDNDIIIKLDPYHKAKYNIKIYFNGNERKEDAESIAANDALYLRHEEWAEECNDTLSVCYIQIDISRENKNLKDESLLEFSIRSVASPTVTYISKNVMKIDYVQNNNSQYYYTELGMNEHGFVTVNFLRGSGIVYSKIVSKNVTEENPDWRGKYKLPTDGDLIQMDPFTKKAEFYTFDDECNNGCYLLLNVKSDAIAQDVPINRNYPYSIIVHSQPTSGTYTENPSIKIQVDDFVIGTIDLPEESNRFNQFYTVWLNEDAEELIIDLQSDAGGLFIKVGDTKPTTTEYDIAIKPQGKDTIHIIKKSDLLKNSSVKSLKNLNLTLGIGTNTTDSVYTTLFAFVVRLGNGNNDIYRVNSDQKALCKARYVKDNVYRCLYVVEYDYISDFSNLFIYTSVQSKSAFFNLYADYIDHIDYEMNNINKIPTKGNSQFASTDLSADYLYIPDGLPKGKYLLVNAEADRETTIELMSTFCSFLNGVTPNPATPQLFMAVTNYTFSLSFPSENMVMVNLRGIGGSAEIHWENDTQHKYYLKGRDDRLAITSDKSNSVHKLLITATSNIQDGAGFVFYVTFNIRIDDANFDPLTLDRSVNYVYSSSDLPIAYYTPVDITNMKDNDSFDIFFSFSLLENEVEKKLTYYENIPFAIKGYVVPESTIYEAKLTPDMAISFGSSVSGIYDQALRTGIIHITKKFIENSNAEGPKYLYIKIEKSEKFKDVRNYKRISVETTILQSSSKVSVSELSYQFGNINKDQNQREYLLRTDRNLKYIMLQFSCHSENITLKLNETNFSLKEISNKYGKNIYLIDTSTNGIKPNAISILIKRKEGTLNRNINYTFQYTNTNITQYQYSIPDTKINVKQTEINNGIDYTIVLSPVENYKNYENINYIVRLRKSRRRKIKSYISIRNDQDEQNVKEFYDPTVENDKITLKITNCTKSQYIQVIAQIKNKEAVEYLSYDIFELESQKKDSAKPAGMVALVIIGSILFCVIIALVVVIIVFNNKNKSLLDKVNQVSFAQDNTDDDLLISADKIN